MFPRFAMEPSSGRGVCCATMSQLRLLLSFALLGFSVVADLVAQTVAPPLTLARRYVTPSGSTQGEYGSVRQGGGTYLVGGDRGTIWRSEDGVHWETYSQSLPANQVYPMLAYAGGFWLASLPEPNTGGQVYGIYRSTDAGRTWSKQAKTMTRPGNEELIAVNDRFFFGHEYSFDGVNWTRLPATWDNVTFVNVVYGGGAYIALIRDALGTSRILYSTDFAQWTEYFSTQAYLRGAAYAGGRFVVLGSASGSSPAVQLTSLNGQSWTQEPALSPAPTGIVALGNYFVLFPSLGTTTDVRTVTPPAQSYGVAGTGGVGAAGLVTLTNSADGYLYRQSVTGAPPALINLPAVDTLNAGAVYQRQLVADKPATSFGATGLPAGLTINAATGLISGQTTVQGTHPIVVYAANGDGTGDFARYELDVQGALFSPPTFTLPAQNWHRGEGSAPVVFSAGVTGAPVPTLQWRRNGTDIAGSIGSTLLVSPGYASAGLYSVFASNTAGSGEMKAGILGVDSTTKTLGLATEVGPNIPHPNGNIYDQVLLNGVAATITADPGQVVRLSYLDVNGDIVQLEFSGSGTLTISVDNAIFNYVTNKAPSLYNQSGVAYVMGHASIVISGADETTNVSIFSVGRMTAVNQGLFLQSSAYDGVADLALLAINSRNGRFGGIRAANARFWSDGLSGIYAPGVNFSGPVNVHDFLGGLRSPAMLITGTIDVGQINITGGSLFQQSGFPILFGAATKVVMAAGTDSHGRAQPPQANRGVLEREGQDVTSQVIQNPGL